jgi:alcohol dehydrogenase class IV
MEEIVNNLEIPTSLSAYGIGKEDLSELVASGMKVTRLLVNNMREIKEEDARDLYLQIM